MPIHRAWLALVCLAGLRAQSIRVDRVIPSFGETPQMLAPGMPVSIYGSNLGPAVGCVGYGDQKQVETLPPDNPFHIWERLAIYPKQLCGVQVMIGDVAAGLLWAQAGQINFQVPRDCPFEGAADLRVLYAGVKSAPFPLRFGLERMTITQDEPAYAGMPVWVRVHTASDLIRPIEFPFREDPLWLMCTDIEVRRNGAALPRQTARNRIGWVGSGSICGTIGLPEKSAKPGRLPLHLFYRFDQPGAYEVRFTRMGGDNRTIRDRTEWTTIQVRPAGDRAAWLRRLSTKEMLTDYLPSLMGYGDAASLPLIVKGLHAPDEVTRQFAMYGLADYYDRDSLLAALRQTPPNETITRFLSYLRKLE
ncbi:MAG TPA: hypothetical protein VG456_11525 [Candidatus Sulfopaludibacter sp.]|jgi:hypothetical protein|nr:hypothetical protein [Candidatus Sulfopaludibacter sp.]